MKENLIILFALLPCIIGTWWGLVLLVNWSMGFKLKEVYAKIYSDPRAAAIMRVGVMAIVAMLVIAAFGRWV